MSSRVQKSHKSVQYVQKVPPEHMNSVVVSKRLLKKIKHNIRRMALALIGVSALLIYKMARDDTIDTVPEIDPFHMYSGVHPELYKRYLVHKKEGNNKKAQDTLEELALYADADFIDEIHEKILKRQKSLFI